MSVNAYSRTWFDVFGDSQPHTSNEVEFLVRNLPNPPCRRVLDLCCGRGRHSIPLARAGYDVVGVDSNADALDEAQKRDEVGAEFVELDVRDLRELPGKFDAVICLWQSFGFFGERDNERLLSDVARKLGPGGRFILDIYNRDYWSRNSGETSTTRAGTVVRARNAMSGSRLSVELRYDGVAAESFEWQLFTVDEIAQLSARNGLTCLFTCTEYDENKPVSVGARAMQLVLQRQG